MTSIKQKTPPKKLPCTAFSGAFETNPPFLSYVKPEQHHVAILHHIFLAFAADEALLFCRGHRAVGDQILIRNHLSADEAALKIRMDFSGCLGAFVPRLIVQARTSGLPAVR